MWQQVKIAEGHNGDDRYFIVEGRTTLHIRMFSQPMKSEGHSRTQLIIPLYLSYKNYRIKAKLLNCT